MKQVLSRSLFPKTPLTRHGNSQTENLDHEKPNVHQEPNKYFLAKAWANQNLKKEKTGSELFSILETNYKQYLSERGYPLIDSDYCLQSNELGFFLKIYLSLCTETDTDEIFTRRTSRGICYYGISIIQPN